MPRTNWASYLLLDKAETFLVAYSGDVSKAAVKRRWDYNHADTFEINQAGARFIFSIVSFLCLSFSSLGFLM